MNGIGRVEKSKSVTSNPFFNRQTVTDRDKRAGQSPQSKSVTSSRAFRTLLLQIETNGIGQAENLDL